jgi:hypothetical protein
MQGTYNLPSGGKVRIASTRRFVVVRDIDPPRILKRSDDLAKARTERARFGNALVVDTVGRKVEVVRDFKRVWIDA